MCKKCPNASKYVKNVQKSSDLRTWISVAVTMKTDLSADTRVPLIPKECSFSGDKSVKFIGPNKNNPLNQNLFAGCRLKLNPLDQVRCRPNYDSQKILYIFWGVKWKI